MIDTLPPEGTAYSRTLQRAAATAGSVEELAIMLHVSAADLARWIVGDGRPPQDIFLACLDIVSGAAYERRARDSQDAADRAQGVANRAQATSDRAQLHADRMRAQADRARANGMRDEQSNGMTDDEQKPESNQPDSESKPKSSK